MMASGSGSSRKGQVAMKRALLVLVTAAALMGVLSASSVAREGTAEVQASSSHLCPPKSDKSSWFGLTTQCQGEIPLNCLNRPHHTDQLADNCGYSSRAAWQRQYFPGWECELEMTDCYPRPCKREFNLSLAFYETSARKTSEVLFPMVLPGMGLASIAAEASYHAQLARKFRWLSEAASNNVLVWCSDATFSRLVDAHTRALRLAGPSLKITLAKGVGFKSLPKKLQYRKVTGLILKSVDAASNTPSGPYGREIPLRYSGKTFEAKLSLDLRGDLGLSVSPR